MTIFDFFKLVFYLFWLFIAGVLIYLGWFVIDLLKDKRKRGKK